MRPFRILEEMVPYQVIHDSVGPELTGGDCVHASVCCPGPLNDWVTLVVSGGPDGSQFSPLPGTAPLDGVRPLLHPYLLSMTLC